VDNVTFIVYILHFQPFKSDGYGRFSSGFIFSSRKKRFFLEICAKLLPKQLLIANEIAIVC
jgi:hypothetical protein